MTRTSCILAAALVAAGLAGCDVPAYELGYDETGVVDATDPDALVDARDTSPTIDSTVIDTVVVDTSDAADSRAEADADAVDAADTTDAQDAFDGDAGCKRDEDCAAGTICAADGDCKPGCTATHKCPTGQDCCGAACLDVTSDVLHCGSCSPCAIAHGTPKCEASTCKVATCDAGFDDCDGKASNGCEAPLDTTTNCGTCGVKCEVPNGLGTCGGGSCTLAGCFSGFDDCDKVVGNGCEVDLTRDPSHCGACSSVCPSTGGTPVCVARTCKYSTCLPGFGDCDLSGRCLTAIQNDIANCGACGKTCTTANGTPKCTSTTCGIASCATGFDDCNKIVADGCEKSLRTLGDCGACGVGCTLPGAATTSCTTGACKVSTCNAGTGNCNGSDVDGCETDTTSTVAHCGSCGAPCSVPNATPSCSGSTCGISSCNAGFANCDSSSATGCERSMGTDQNTCATAQVLTGAGAITSFCVNGTGESTTTVSSFGRKFYKVTTRRCSGCGGSTSRAKFVVKSPAGMAFDLRVYSDAGCSTLVGSSVSGVLGGTETVTWSDAACPTPKDFLIEVKWRSGDGCGLATLDVTGAYTPFP